jgi:hypothetical protein
LEKAGFGGVLLYIDPCDLPKTANLDNDTFMVALNPGGDPSTPGYPSVGKFVLVSFTIYNNTCKCMLSKSTKRQ